MMRAYRQSERRTGAFRSHLVPSANNGAATQHPISFHSWIDVSNAPLYGSGCESLMTSFSASLSNKATALGSLTFLFFSKATLISIALSRHRSLRTYLQRRGSQCKRY